MSDFQHEPLADPTSTIRVLKILPSSTRKRIKYQLQHVSMEDKPDYIALSYTWGAPQTKHKCIVLNGQMFPVRDNLYDFLDRCRRKKDDSLFWIDAMSIDQSNNEEKSQQVQMMGRIYECAKVVYAWLGRKGSRRLRWSMLWYLYCDRHYAPFFKFPSLHCRMLLTASLAKRNCLSLCRNPYWTRIWAIQEIGLSRNRCFLMGSASFTSSDINKLVYHMIHEPGTV